ncbi:hypothetical protein GWK47_014602 [Chionoecetes opilio]|uniref:Peptidase A2 domain-containing protein n=1 Tax=Chionoecetes opilio TaxID=41210 RepID=A0A8J4XSS3_CHIOP|nr:hypothetical protein GWK47_014602 [Chionoecetes opilio]
MTCTEIQLKIVLLMGVRDEELIQRLISLDTGASLQDVVTCCRSFEATCHTASVIYSSPSQLRVMSTYKKGRRHDKTPHSPQQPPSGQRVKTQHRTAVPSPVHPCQSCARRHGPKCPARAASCYNCGRQGHWAGTDKCPTKTAQCRLCTRTGHYDRFCRNTPSHDGQGGALNVGRASPTSRRKYSNCRSLTDVSPSSAMTPTPVCFHLVHGESTSRFQMLPDTGADITVIGTRHLQLLHIPLSSL